MGGILLVRGGSGAEKSSSRPYPTKGGTLHLLSGGEYKGLDALGASMLQEANSHCPSDFTAQPQTMASVPTYLSPQDYHPGSSQDHLSPCTHLVDFGQPTHSGPGDCSRRSRTVRLKCFCSFQTHFGPPARLHLSIPQAAMSLDYLHILCLCSHCSLSSVPGSHVHTCLPCPSSPHACWDDSTHS